MKIFATLSLFLCSFAIAQVDEDFVGLYEFESGTENSIGNYGHGISFGNVTYVDGVNGKAVSFDGSSRIQIANGEDVFGQNPSEWSISFWAKDRSLSTISTYMADYHGTPGHDPRYAFLFNHGIDGINRAAIRNIKRDDHFTIFNDLASPYDEWFHLALVASKITGIATFYVNGIEVGSEALTSGVDYFSDTPIHIGNVVVNNTHQQFMYGELDELRFYTRALSSVEVAALADLDSDQDGVMDDADLCSLTPEGSIVDGFGCSIPQSCPCEEFKNHGKYVSCISLTAGDFISLGLITNKEKSNLVSNAAKFSCKNK